MNILIIWCLYADFKHLGGQNHREKSCYVASEFIALSLLVGIYYNGYIQTHCQTNKKIKRADQILPEVYGTTLSEQRWEICFFDIGGILERERQNR